MVSTSKNSLGHVIGYIEWNMVDVNGVRSDTGEYIYINNMWIHKNFRDTGVFRDLIEKIEGHPFSAPGKWVYWEIVRDGQRKKIIEEEDRPFMLRRTSRLFDRKYIVNKIIQGAGYDK